MVGGFPWLAVAVHTDGQEPEVALSNNRMTPSFGKSDVPTMPNLTIFVIALCAASLMRPTYAGAEELSADPVVVMSTTVVSGTSSGYVNVQVPAGVSVDFADSENGRYRAPAGFSVDTPQDRMAGFALTWLEEIQPGVHQERVLRGYRFPSDMTFDDGLFDYESAADGGLSRDTLRGSLPAGNYRLYLYTEPGVPTDITLDFVGAPQGTLRLAPERSIRDFTVIRPDNEIPAADDGTAFRAKAQRRYHDTDETGYALSAVAIRGTAPGVWRSTQCTYTDANGFSPAYDAPTCVPARAVTLTSQAGGSAGGNPGTRPFIPLPDEGEAFIRTSTYSGTGSAFSTVTASVTTTGIPPMAAVLFAWFDLASY